MSKVSNIKWVFLTLFIVIIFWVYRGWFLNNNIVGGDWIFFFDDVVKDFPFFPPSWSTAHGNGLGGVITAYFIDSYLYFTLWIGSNVLQIPWSISSKFFWFFLPLFASFFSSYFFSKLIFKKYPYWVWSISSLIYTTNTYILMIVSGGQMGIFLAYSVAPLVLVYGISLINLFFEGKFLSLLRKSIILGLILALQFLFDPRFCYILLGIIFLYFFFNAFIKNKIGLSRVGIGVVICFVLPSVIILLLNFFWIFPIFVVRSNPVHDLGIFYSSSQVLEFFSFSPFSNGFSLLHPNWPENIFGKTYFIRPEFILLAVFSYLSLLFIKPQKQSYTKENIWQVYILFFALLGLLGAFLSKGVNPPFGAVYEWMFLYLPGFVAFRDSTKFFILTIISYSILVPFSLFHLSNYFKKYNKYSNHILLLVFILFWLITIREAIVGTLSGTFQKHDVPNEYISLKKKISNESQFYRTLWVPYQNRFSYSSDNHPAIEAAFLFNATDAAQMNWAFNKSNTKNLLENLSVRYVIIQYDVLGERFLDDRKYSEKVRQSYESMLDSISYLKKIEDGKITIYEMPYYKSHFWLDEVGSVFYSVTDSSRYLIDINTEKEVNLVFAENYNDKWKLKSGSEILTSKKTKDGLNSFYIKNTGKFSGEVFYEGELYYMLGRVISLSALCLMIFILFVLHFKNYFRHKSQS